MRYTLKCITRVLRANTQKTRRIYKKRIYEACTHTYTYNVCITDEYTLWIISIWHSGLGVGGGGALIYFCPPLPQQRMNHNTTDKRGTDVTKFNTPRGSKPPHVQVGVFESLQIRSVCKGVLSLLICSVHKFLSYQLWKYCCAKFKFSQPINLVNRVLFNVWGNYWSESSRKCG